MSCPGPGAPHVLGTTTYHYDGDGETTSVVNPAGRVTTLRYNTNGNLSQVTQPDRPVTSTTSYSYNALGEQTAKASNGIVVATATYDLRGDELAQADAARHVTRYRYNLLGEVTSAVSPQGQTTAYRYNRAGDRTGVTAPSGRSTSYTYDAANEMTAASYGAGRLPAIRFSYYPDGQQQTVANAAGATTYVYDADQRLKSSSTSTAGAPAETYFYSYDGAKRQVTLTYPNGHNVVSSYNGAGELSSVRDWLGDTIRYGYGPDGNLTSAVLPGGVRASYGGTAISVISRGQGPVRFTESTDPAGRLVSTGTTGIRGVPAVRTAYHYNGLGQLTAAGSQSYGYDPAGDLDALPGGVTERFSKTGELTTASGGLHYSYDKNGNLTSVSRGRDRQQKFGYDQANQLTSYRGHGTTVRYAYTGDGLLASSTAGRSAAHYVWDQAPGTPVLLTASATSYVYGPSGQPVEQITDGKATFLLADQQGNTRLLTSQSGAITGSYSYRPYGVVARHTGTATTALRYGGQFATGTGYLYLRARYYDPATGQFLTRDPAAAVSGSPYGYAGGNPVNASDPSGMFWNPISLVSSVLSVGGDIVRTISSGVIAAADYIGRNWRTIVHVALGALAIPLACAVVAPACATVLGLILVGVVTASLVSVADYLLSPGPKSWSGVLSSATFGLVHGGVDEASRQAQEHLAGQGLPQAPPAPSSPAPGDLPTPMST